MNLCPIEQERQRQAGLLASVRARALVALPMALNVRESSQRAQRGLQAYRAHAQASAERTLGTTFPTIQALVGVEDFGPLAREFGCTETPVRGDLGQWGAAFPSWLAAHPALAAWPYLSDCARLDWAVHCNERAADAEVDVESMTLLGHADPATLTLQLMPGTTLLESRWPIALLHQAHRTTASEPPDAGMLATAREALAEQQAQSVMVVRKGWRAVAHVLGHVDVAWTASLLEGDSLAAALERAGDAFDFSTWLTTALSARWLQGVVAWPHPAQPPI